MRSLVWLGASFKGGSVLDLWLRHAFMRLLPVLREVQRYAVMKVTGGTSDRYQAFSR